MCNVIWKVMYNVVYKVAYKAICNVPVANIFMYQKSVVEDTTILKQK